MGGSGPGEVDRHRHRRSGQASPTTGMPTASHTAQRREPYQGHARSEYTVTAGQGQGREGWHLKAALQTHWRCRCRRWRNPAPCSSCHSPMPCGPSHDTSQALCTVTGRGKPSRQAHARTLHMLGCSRHLDEGAFRCAHRTHTADHSPEKHGELQGWVEMQLT